jgi:hypothetical protein
VHIKAGIGFQLLGLTVRVQYYYDIWTRLPTVKICVHISTTNARNLIDVTDIYESVDRILNEELSHLKGDEITENRNQTHSATFLLPRPFCSLPVCSLDPRRVLYPLIRCLTTEPKRRVVLQHTPVEDRSGTPSFFALSWSTKRPASAPTTELVLSIRTVVLITLASAR